MSKIHIVTVGASLISNAASQVVEVKEILKNTTRIEDIEKGLTAGVINRNELHNKLLQYLENKKDTACAELATMWAFLDKGKIDQAYLLYTDTEVGDVCSYALQSYLKKRGVYTIREVIKGYKDEISFQREGIPNLALKTWGLIKKHKGHDKVYICATGGFKPETSIVTLIANLQGIPVYYRHEFFKMHVAIPGFPVEWRYQLMEKFSAPLIELINKRIDKNDFYKKFGIELAEQMEDDYWLIKEVDGYYEISPIGRLLYHVMFGS
ncbi:MAG: putative CRISPR-associated protein [Nitrososphaerales archaeon]